MQTLGRSKSAKLVAAFAAAGLVLSPALAAGETKRRPPAVSVSFDPVATFTPATADPRLAAAFAGRSGSLSDFKFTPAAAKGRPSQVRVAIRARAAAPGTRVADAGSTAVTALTPANADPRLAKAFGGRGVSLTDFKFTPSAAKSRPSQVRVAIRARAVAPGKVGLAEASALTSSTVSALTPAS